MTSGGIMKKYRSLKLFSTFNFETGFLKYVVELNIRNFLFST